MTQGPTPRSDPTEDHQPTPVLQLRLRIDAPSTTGAWPSLHSVAELYERRGSKWSRLSCRTGPLQVDAALEGEPYLQALKDLLWLLELPPGQDRPDT